MVFGKINVQEIRWYERTKNIYTLYIIVLIIIKIGNRRIKLMILKINGIIKLDFIYRLFLWR